MTLPRRRPLSNLPRLLTAALAVTLAAPPTRAAPASPGPAARASLVRELRRVTEGLLFVSEADFPLHVVYWRRPGGPLTAERVAARLPRPPAHLDAGAEVHDGARGHLLEEDTVDGFFSVATTPRPWHTDRDRADVRRYQELVRTLKARLHDLHVFRFGASTIRAYIMGVTPDGDWAGVSTILIET